MKKTAAQTARLVVVRELEHPDAMQRVLAVVYLLELAAAENKSGRRAA